MFAYRIMLVSGALIPIGIFAVYLLHNGWEAVAAALTIFAGLAFVGAAVVIGAAGDRLRPRGT